MANEIKIFISYSHVDEELRRELEAHLAFLREYGNPIWHDRRIPAGSEWTKEIDIHLNTSNIILLLISSDFIFSNYCYDIEFKQAMVMHEAKKAVVIPIIVREVFWRFGDLKKLQALPEDGKPIIGDHWKGNKDAAFRNVAEGVREIVQGIAGEPQAVTPSMTVVHSQNISVASAHGHNNLDQLYAKLVDLDYHKQRKVFRQFMDSGYRTGAFLIHGEPECGQRWLLNRFLWQISGSSMGKPAYKFSFERKGGGRSLDDLWNDLGEWCGLSYADPPPAKLAEEVHKLWQTQTVILILDGLHEIEQEHIEKFIHLFWIPLAERAKSNPCLEKNYCLLFLIDGQGCHRTFPFARQLDAWEPRIPIELEKLTRFSDQVVSAWADSAGIDILPANVTAQDLLTDCEEGLPELVFKRVCQLCGDNWYRREKVWMMY